MNIEGIMSTLEEEKELLSELITDMPEKHTDYVEGDDLILDDDIGLGAIGMQMAPHLIRAGFTVTSLSKNTKSDLRVPESEVCPWDEHAD